LPQHGFNSPIGELIEGGADTTSAQLLALMLAFALHPGMQKKARAKIDAVCLTERLPVWTDFSQLLYINSIIKEEVR
jgi:cytochrome P450